MCDGAVVVIAQDGAVGVEEVIGESAHLCAASAVGGASGEVFGEVASSGVGDAEGSVDEGFEFDVGYGVANGLYLVEREFACKDDACEAEVAESGYLFGCAVVALGGGVEAERGEVLFEQAEVLDDEGVCSGVVEVPCEGDGLWEFVVGEDGV